MSGVAGRPQLATEPDFAVGPLKISPSSCRVMAGGSEVRVEAQTMSVLILLARAGGATVSRDQLVQACWQGRVVSDDAIARAIAKVRALSAIAEPAAFTLETIPKVGYRLLAAATLAEGGAPATMRPFRALHLSRQNRWLAAGAAGLAALGAVVLIGGGHMTGAAAAPQSPVPAIHSAEVTDALLNLDEARLGVILKAGWDPNWRLDSEGNASLHILMEVCERNHAHDKAGVVRVARQLMDAGADPALMNKWTDTPMIIASAKRYCGPDHPVVAQLRQALARKAAAKVDHDANGGR